MNLSEKFRRFAAECKGDVQIRQVPGDQATWDAMAARWILFAELADDRYSPKVNTMPRRRRRAWYYLN